ncbi:nuclear transport factor 2 family protein [Hydrogenophaga sp. BPS33]|uniref:nuclear transport factor 2 family protein n=1 Tax=Hydrogenophaga sp. BPS33 TaxID=2651974 RepID=UPI00131FF21F|nr:nuclear transport factor 2 family protein [Hydrogenophaga sp. BPS33]QHE83708.1 nuclear transport factor 2 family protein [Hydrogenophaga sp. BPS33]
MEPHTGLQQAIEAADDERFRAKIACDWPALERLFADELVYVHVNGRSDSKASLLESLRSRRVHYLAARRHGTQVRSVGGLALMSGRLELDFALAGEQRTSDCVYVSVWCEKDGAWQMLHWHSTSSTAAAKT